LRGEKATFEGRVFESRWAARREEINVPVVLAVSGPKAVELGCEVADGMLLSMGFGPENIAYVDKLVDHGCALHGRDRAELDLWWNTEMVVGESVEEAQSRRLGVATEWLTMGSMEGKQIPLEMREPLVAFNHDIHEISSQYQMVDREKALIQRARDVGIYDWLLTRSAGFWGTPADIAGRLAEHAAEGRDKWMFYIGRDEATREEEVRVVCEEIMPLLPASTR
jgi:5,10-methylenetetrahydromethanopterin reductase